MNQSGRIYENHMCVLQHECKSDLCINEYYFSSGENDTLLQRLLSYSFCKLQFTKYDFHIFTLNVKTVL